MGNNRIKSTISFGLLTIGMAIITLLGYGYYYVSELENQITERDRLIQNLSFRSNLVEEYFDIKVDSTQNTTSYMLKDSKKTRIIEHKETTIEKCDEELISNYNKLVEEYKLINIENFKYKNKISEQKKVLELIERNYQINYNVSVDSIYSRIKLINTEKIDSALLLLPYYRDRLERIDEKTWTITKGR
ncbi:MAG: hypothetical protein MJZ31_03135 [Bacteroidales bacterium]|nr:hypothetical protein [Bacteroidales bacterium]